MLSWRSSTVRQPSIRPARKSEWLRCALAHHYNPDLGVENEIVVLATGVDQYLQEIFHHLAFYNSNDFVSQEDFKLLCQVLGFSSTRESDVDKREENQEYDICSALPRELNFKEFHARLCGYFNLKVQNGKTTTRLPVSEETEHIEREIKLRWPRIRRRKCVSFDLSMDHTRKKPQPKSVNMSKVDNLSTCALECAQETGDKSWKEQLELENASLRELVEDLRSALQGSDARCMALEVALRKERGGLSDKVRAVASESEGTVGVGETKSRRPNLTDWETKRGTKDLLRELQLIRDSRDGQLEEALRFNQRLEEELRAAYRETSRLEEVMARLRKENVLIKRKAEEARGALAAGLERVRTIQDQAKQITPLQDKIHKLETELERFRLHCTCRILGESKTEPPVMPSEPTTCIFSTGRDEVLIRGEEGLQRAVEGRAASDEEEEERGRETGQCCLLEVKRLINRPHNCVKGCQSTTAHHLLTAQNCSPDADLRGLSGQKDTRTWNGRHHTHLEQKESESEKALQLKQGKVDLLKVEVQMVEMERERLSLLEEKLKDALELLLQLHHKKFAHWALGKILMDTLDECCGKGLEPTRVLQVVDVLCQQLLSTERVDTGSEVGEMSQRRVTLENRGCIKPLVIC
ncbi:EF-hand and coiled-coil domain-containing protein 1 [Chanos chanos]|uniref:EF-hand and coiled-coil domain-containing protein 1 n=1 Tax=Chanos chanos TaxID=29144 RepID=A0A6J2VMF1_CHACN|nr:EF-hand and coiled-coil domain-containing protein 1-like [Chanos chanos]